MADVKWIKITTDVFNDEKMLLIDGLPERDGIIVIWFKLLCLAGKQNNGGVFMLNDRIAFTDEMLAQIFHRPTATVKLALKAFEDFGMIEIVNNTITIPNWEKHQSLDKLEQAKEKNRLRVAAHRERQKALASGNDYCNVTGVTSNDADKEEDKEKDKEEDKEIKKEKKQASKKAAPASSFDSLIDKYSKGNEEVKELLGEWLKVRKAKRAAMTDRAIELNLQKLDRLAAESNLTVAEYLKEIICRGWQAFYVITSFGNKASGTNKPRYGDFDVKEAFELGLERTYGDKPKEEPKTAAEDESIRERAEALRRQFAEC